MFDGKLRPTPVCSLPRLGHLAKTKELTTNKSGFLPSALQEKATPGIDAQVCPPQTGVNAASDVHGLDVEEAAVPSYPGQSTASFTTRQLTNRTHKPILPRASTEGAAT